MTDGTDEAGSVPEWVGGRLVWREGGTEDLEHAWRRIFGRPSDGVSAARDSWGGWGSVSLLMTEGRVAVVGNGAPSEIRLDARPCSGTLRGQVRVPCVLHFGHASPCLPEPPLLLPDDCRTAMRHGASAIGTGGERAWCLSCHDEVLPADRELRRMMTSRKIGPLGWAYPKDFGGFAAFFKDIPTSPLSRDEASAVPAHAASREESEIAGPRLADGAPPDLQALLDVVVVASTSEIKLRAVRDALRDEDIVSVVEGFEPLTAVGPQPLGIDETALGAKQRLSQARDYHPGKAIVAIENGIMVFQARYEEICMEVAVVVIEDRSGRQVYTTSLGLEVPGAAVTAARIRKTTMAAALAEGVPGADPKDPIALLTGGAHTRRELLTDAVKLAITRLAAMPAAEPVR